MKIFALIAVVSRQMEALLVPIHAIIMVETRYYLKSLPLHYLSL